MDKYQLKNYCKNNIDNIYIYFKTMVKTYDKCASKI